MAPQLDKHIPISNKQRWSSTTNEWDLPVSMLVALREINYLIAWDRIAYGSTYITRPYALHEGQALSPCAFPSNTKVSISELRPKLTAIPVVPVPGPRSR